MTARWAAPASPSIRTGRNRCPTTGPSATSSAWRWTRATTSGSSTGPAASTSRNGARTPTRRSPSAAGRRRRSSSSTRQGDVVQAWGGPGHGFEWPQSEHGIFIDHLDNVWLAGSGGNDSQILKFTRHGRFLLQIGAQGQGQGSNDLANFGQPAEIDVDPETNEVYIADGYGNRRVAVFDADTGEYRRHWGAYGNVPTDDAYTYDPDAPLSQQFGRPVHCATLSDDGLVYVCDRVNDRIQVFQRDGTFLDEVLIAPRTRDFGSAFDVDFSPDPEQRFMYNIDGMNQKVWIISREDLSIVDSFGFGGHRAGGFTAAHSLAVDASGNIYVGETLEGKRVQRFVRQ